MSLQTGKVLTVENKDGRISLSVESETQTIEDISLARFGSDTYQVSVGSRVYLLPLAGADGEFVAFPASEVASVDIRLVGGTSIILANDPGNATAFPTMQDFNDLRDWVERQFDAASGHTHPGIGTPPVTVPGSGGAPSAPIPAPVFTTVTKAE